PRRIPHQRDIGIAHARHRDDAHLDFARHRFGDRAMRGGQRHHHRDVAVRADVDAVDEAEIVDVHRNLGIVDALERLDHAFVERAAGLGGVLRLRLLREEAFEIVALALELLVRRFLDRVLDSSSGRSFDSVDFFHGEALVGFLDHPKILLVRSIPRSSAATSSSSLYNPKLARAVAGTPRRSIKGWAQWWPARIATFSSSNMVPRSCG